MQLHTLNTPCKQLDQLLELQRRLFKRRLRAIKMKTKRNSKFYTARWSIERHITLLSVGARCRQLDLMLYNTLLLSIKINKADCLHVLYLFPFYCLRREQFCDYAALIAVIAVIANQNIDNS